MSAGQGSFTLIRDIKDKMIANIHGIVDYCKKPTSLKKLGEFCMSLKIVDETSVDGLPCVLFGTLETLPVQIQEGDIVRFKSLRIGKYKNYGLQAKNTRWFQWLLLQDQQRIHSGPHCIVTEEDMQRVKELTEWNNNSVKISNGNPNGNRTKRLCDITGRKAELANIVVQVVSIHPSVSDHKCVFITVWDGSDPVCQTLDHTGKGKALDEPPAELADLAEGRTYDIQAFENHAENALYLKPGQMLLMLSLSVELVTPKMLILSAIHGFIHHTLMPQDIKWIKLMLHDRVSRGPELCPLTDRDIRAEKTLESIKLLTGAIRIHGNDQSIKAQGSSGMACDMQFGCEKVDERLSDMVQAFNKEKPAERKNTQAHKDLVALFLEKLKLKENSNELISDEGGSDVVQAFNKEKPAERKSTQADKDLVPLFLEKLKVKENSNQLISDEGGSDVVCVCDEVPYFNMEEDESEDGDYVPSALFSRSTFSLKRKRSRCQTKYPKKRKSWQKIAKDTTAHKLIPIDNNSDEEEPTAEAQVRDCTHELISIDSNSDEEEPTAEAQVRDCTHELILIDSSSDEENPTPSARKIYRADTRAKTGSAIMDQWLKRR